jgi:hypothetical protein
MYKYENLPIRKCANAFLNEGQNEIKCALIEKFPTGDLDSYDEINLTVGSFFQQQAFHCLLFRVNRYLKFNHQNPGVILQVLFGGQFPMTIVTDTSSQIAFS